VTQPAVNNESQKIRYLQFSALIAASIAIWWRPLVATGRIAASTEAHTHILLVLPLSLALIYFENGNRTTRFATSWFGIGFLIAALAIRMLPEIILFPANDGVSIGMFGLVVWWIGSVTVCFGAEILRVLSFQLCFLFLLVPFPEPVLKEMTEFMQRASAWAAAILFHLAGVPGTRDGVLISIPGLTIEVAQECSSIRSSMMLLLITLILAYLFLDTWWRKTLLILAVIPLSIAKNALRIFTIPELGTRVDPSYLHGKLHHHGGILFLGLAVIAILLLLWVLRKGDARNLPCEAAFSGQ